MKFKIKILLLLAGSWGSLYSHELCGEDSIKKACDCYALQLKAEKIYSLNANNKESIQKIKAKSGGVKLHRRCGSSSGRKTRKRSGTTHRLGRSDKCARW
jgi:hypothetical protein